MNPGQESARYEQEQEREQQRQNLRREKAITDVFAKSPVLFKVSPDEVIRALGTVTFDADGVPLNAGKPLAERLKDYAAINPVAVASNIAEAHDKGASTIKSRADFKSRAEKVAYLAEFGDLAYARLPATPTEERPDVPQTLDDYRKLPLRDRARLSAERPGLLTELQRAADAQRKYDRLVGTPLGTRRA